MTARPPRRSPWHAPARCWPARLRARRAAWLALAVVPAFGMLPVTCWLGMHGPVGRACKVGVVCLLYLAGVVLHARTLSGQRGRVASAGFHGAAYVGATLLEPWLVIPFGLYLARAMVLPTRALSLRAVGGIEATGAAVLGATLLLAV
ncbi:hypothetical protein [Streptomyces sp. RPT161]|uniref:hypothetical protein n=1 Tax=Streptomyces sp. RPT161 TaxID=3015993 RepID=UPI0022B8B72B|nr:hypothetical protein [Streptomyces sp. RPT161]